MPSREATLAHRPASRSSSEPSTDRLVARPLLAVSTAQSGREKSVTLCSRNLLLVAKREPVANTRTKAHRVALAQRDDCKRDGTPSPSCVSLEPMLSPHRVAAVTYQRTTSPSFHSIST